MPCPFSQRHNCFCVRLCLELYALRLQILAQLFEILDDPIVHDGHAALLMRVGVGLCRSAMGGPAGVTNAGLARERFMHQSVRQIYQLANGAPPPKTSI